MSDKNGSPPRLSAGAESSESEQPDGARPRARRGSTGEPTPYRKPTQAQAPEAPLPSHRHSPSPEMLDRSLQAQLGRQLRAIYSDIAEEPVPERFIRLLEELEATERLEEKRQ